MRDIDGNGYKRICVYIYFLHSHNWWIIILGNKVSAGGGSIISFFESLSSNNLISGISIFITFLSFATSILITVLTTRLTFKIRKLRAGHKYNKLRASVCETLIGFQKNLARNSKTSPSTLKKIELKNEINILYESSNKALSRKEKNALKRLIKDIKAIGASNEDMNNEDISNKISKIIGYLNNEKEAFYD